MIAVYLGIEKRFASIFESIDEEDWVWVEVDVVGCVREERKRWMFSQV